MTSRFVFLHPSDELYGADRMLVEMVDALVDTSTNCAVEVWLPIDLEHPPSELSLCTLLGRRGVMVRHLDLPILRRAYRNPGGMVHLALRAFRLFRHLRRSRADVVYCTTSAALLGAPVAAAARVPRVIGHVQEIWSRGDAVVLTGAAHFCCSVITISHAVADALPRRLRARVHVVPNAVPDPGEPSSSAGSRDNLTFLVASRWNAWKGHRTLLEAWEAAGSPGSLVVLGGPPRSGEHVDVEALVSALRRPETVRVVGEVEDPLQYFDQADVVLIPSDEPEPFGLVAIEAFARSRPVIGSAAGGLLEIITTGVDGWLFPPRDVEALAAVLTDVTQGAVTSAGKQARRSYEQRFTSTRFRQEWRAQVLAPEIAADERRRTFDR